MDAILEQFLSEARDNLSYIDLHLCELEKQDVESMNALFRAAHTLKGGAGLVGFVAVKEITHAAEDLLDALRNKKISYDEQMLGVLYQAFDEVVELVDAAEYSGGLNIIVDDNKINSIKSEILKFIEPIKSESIENKKYETSLRIADAIHLGAFSTKQIERICEYAPKSRPDISKEFLANKNYWVVELDLDVETVKLGNDPLYMFYMLGEESVLEVSVEIFGSSLDSDPLEWTTKMVAVIYADEQMIEDSFYNVLEECLFAPLSLENILLCSYPNIKNDAFDEFVKDIKQSGIVGLAEKLDIVLKLLNTESREFFILNRLKTLFAVRNDFDIVKTVLATLGITITQKEQNKLTCEADAAVKLLKAQRLALKAPNSIDRTKTILQKVLGFMSLGGDIQSIETVEEMELFIDSSVEMIIKSADYHIASNEVVNKEEKSEIKHPEQSNVKKDNAPIKTIKIEQEEIDHLMDIVGEILVLKNSLPYIALQLNPQNIHQAKRELAAKYDEITRVTNQLQDLVMNMRLLPISYIFNRYPKLIREISKSLNKSIEYIEYGGDTKLDKMMIEKIADPLVHLIRNSLDHGIETEAQRVKSGKEAKGVLRVGAKNVGDRVFIEIYDDGKGIDCVQVAVKAVEKGLIDSDAVDKMSDEDKLKLIFLPGLSTKDVVSDLSGRGVGTDAVKSAVEELGGKINLSSQIGLGTTVTIEIPVSVALTNVFHVLLDSVNYAVAMENVLETEKIKSSDIKTANHNLFINLRGELIPLMMVSELLNRKQLKAEENLIIIKTKIGKIAMIVDKLIGQLDVVQKPLTGALKNHPLVNGVALLGNGQPLLVIDVNNYVKGSV